MDEIESPEIRDFWVIDHANVKVTKEQCSRSLIRPNHWFCARYNFASIEGSKVFATKELALAVLRRDMKMRLEKARSNYEKALAIED